MTGRLSKRAERLIRRRLARHLRTVETSHDQPRRHRAARAAARDAEQLGLITRPPSCEACRSREHALQRHHWNYDEPLRVVFLCPPCHKVADQMVADYFVHIKDC